ncbi:MAG TPA: ParB/RepB/Spo0J family partition protein [Gemmatimonadales bacterium]|jgi:ParB family chromosome partitioning protein|nr:ParB/RepB/Spo0J family partition protein [Gemmatimonadales bacterium]
MTETKRLGRGLEALLGSVTREQAQASGALRELPINVVVPNPYQPRTQVDEAALAELTASIEASGLLQPVVVRPRNGKYELIAGERRWRAVQRLNWTKIPAIVKDVDDPTLLTLALVENLQRDELTAIDEAAGYERLGSEFKLAQGEIARLVGRNRSTVTNRLRLLKLPDEVKNLVQERKLSEGHARALLGVSQESDIIPLARQAVELGWSVRDLEVRARADGSADRAQTASAVATTPTPASRPAPRPINPDVRRVEDALRKRLGTDIRVTTRRRGRGFISISYYSNDDLARVLDLILGEPFAG